MKFSRVVLVMAAVVLTGYVAVQCGDDDDNNGECNPPCGAGQVCVSGVCQAVGADADADGDGDVQDVEPEADVIPDTDPDVAPDVTPDVTPDDTTTDDTTTDDGTPVERNTGEPCTTATDCVGPTANCMTELTLPVVGAVAFPGGYCSSACGPDGDCGPDGYCLDASAFGGPTGCVKACESNADCREGEGYVCNGFGIFSDFCAPPLGIGG